MVEGQRVSQEPKYGQELGQVLRWLLQVRMAAGLGVRVISS